MKIFKRTFEAAKFPKGSEERARLNLQSETSEYMPSHKYIVADTDYKEVKNSFSKSFRTKQEAETFLALQAGTHYPMP